MLINLKPVGSDSLVIIDQKYSAARAEFDPNALRSALYPINTLINLKIYKSVVSASSSVVKPSSFLSVNTAAVVESGEYFIFKFILNNFYESFILSWNKKTI